MAHYEDSMQNVMRPREYEHVDSEFDRLRKRVSYLTKGKNSLLKGEGIVGVDGAVPSNM